MQPLSLTPDKTFLLPFSKGKIWCQNYKYECQNIFGETFKSTKGYSIKSWWFLLPYYVKRLNNIDHKPKLTEWSNINNHKRSRLLPNYVEWSAINDQKLKLSTTWFCQTIDLDYLTGILEQLTAKIKNGFKKRTEWVLIITQAEPVNITHGSSNYIHTGKPLPLKIWITGINYSTDYRNILHNNRKSKINILFIFKCQK